MWDEFLELAGREKELQTLVNVHVSMAVVGTCLCKNLPLFQSVRGALRGVLIPPVGVGCPRAFSCWLR